MEVRTLDIMKELEAMRKRMIQEINTEFDLLIERAASEGRTMETLPAEESYESVYPLIAGSKIFKGTKPTSVIFPDQSPVYVSTWKQVVSAIMEQCLQSSSNKAKLFSLSNSISGRKRRILAQFDTDMRSPLKLCDNLYMESHYDTETLLNVLTNRILDAIQYDYTNIQISIRNR